MIRPARESDRPVLRTLQRYLREPAPELLEPSAGSQILVSTIDATAVETGEHGTPESVDGPDTPEAVSGVDTPVVDSPVGYVLWIPSSAGQTDSVYVAELVVAPAFRREGRARRLLLTLLSSLPTGTAVTLQVAVENEAAQALYRELGFGVVGRDEDAYESGPGLRMRTTVTREEEN